MADYKKHRNTFILENVEIFAGPWRNFSGKAGTYNAEGARNFWIVVPQDLAEEMKNDHWNVKEREDADGEKKYLVKININYKSEYPPEIYLVNMKKKKKTLMDEDSIHQLDRAYITNATIAFNPYTRNWTDGRVTTTGWLQSLYVEIEENYLQEKFDDFEDASSPFNEDEDIPF